ncbi:Asp23/Gls24 family envelope stress response protein [Streptomyces pharetrae]|uniref:hypothetical protein n=1 Tax=Streptomyces pharetrae TaxID=291370 RepID=UPI0036A7DC5B
MTAVSEGAGAFSRPPTVVPPGERGATQIADRVVAKIAAPAAGPLPSGASPPHATVAVHHEAARIRVHLELEYPADIGSRCRAVRRQVLERVRGLVGFEVPEVAVQVERLHLPAAFGAAHGRTR